MSKTREVDGIYWWQDSEGIWYVCIEEDKIEEVRNKYGQIGFRNIK